MDICIIPCIWLKPDKNSIYELFTNLYNTISKNFDSYEIKIFNFVYMLHFGFRKLIYTNIGIF